MLVCARCHQENRAGARFCDACGAPLTPDAGPREERKVVTVLFADLVGFTSRTEQLDPEDVRALQDPYWQHVRHELEHYGATIEKYIGDAVVGLFGAPIAHEDDPERAVRAGLAIRDWAREQDEIQVRVGITTGEALVRLGAQPLAGEGMVSGDVVNTASRMQVAAAANTVLVDETTRGATRDVIDYAGRERVTAKGKREPISVWEALDARSRLGVDLLEQERTAFVGRERELEVLEGAFLRVREQRSPQLVTLVGVPGIGKSRLVYELMQRVEADPALVTWRQGRSLPYGDGVSFWALAEIVKAQAGILETDTAAQAEARLTHSVQELLGDGAEAAWVERHLRPLAGLGSEGEGTPDRQSESFAALRRFFEALADARPATLVFEDLHWADDSLLDFVDGLVELITDVPLLVIATARPELLERRPSWGGGKADATTLSLPPLSEAATLQLVRGVVARHALTGEAEQALVAQAAGNPLYAEQYARIWEDVGHPDQITLPGTVQGLIAARLDGLLSIEKSVLQNAAVLGKVFWDGALVAIDGIDAATTRECLRALQRKQFVQRARRSSMESELEYAFHHVLVRDVAYAQIPRRVRAGKHERAASWIESLGRFEDHAEMLAHHYLSALELARDSGGSNDALTAKAIGSLISAGERASHLNAFSSAARYYGQALDLLAEDDERRPSLLFGHARALYASDDLSRVETLERARVALLDEGVIDAAAEAETLLADVAWFEGRSDDAKEHLERAATLIGGHPATAAKARVLAALVQFRMLRHDHAGAIELAEEALALSKAFELPEIQAHTLISRGVSRWWNGDRDGTADVQRGLDVALERNALPVVRRGYTNLAMLAGGEGDRLRRRDLLHHSAQISQRLGDRQMRHYIAAQIAWEQYAAGDWDEARRYADDFIAECDAGAKHVQEAGMRHLRARIRAARDDEKGAVRDIERALSLTRAPGTPQDVGDLGEAMMIYLDLGLTAEAQALAAEILSFGDAARLALFALAWCADRVGLSSTDLEPLLAAEMAGGGIWRRLAALLLKDFSEAADLLAEFGNSASEADARRRAGAMLIERGRYEEAKEQLELALRFARRVVATRHIREAEMLLAQIQTPVS